MRASATLPPLQSLRAFEAVARLLSFRRAGEELLVSQSAISHHIRILETFLGARLFVRKARGVALTGAGERYFRAIETAFASLADATAAARGATATQQVRISLTPSFAANWLVPRLKPFGKAHPNVDLVLDPGLGLADLNAGEADLALRFGRGDWPGVESTLLMAERFTPLASPALIAAGPPLRRPEDILAYPLLTVLNPGEWELWAKAHDLDLRKAQTVQVSDYNIALQAACDGHGVVMARLLLIGNRIESGALARMFPGEATSPGMGHWLVTRRGGPPSAPARTFMDWIQREASAHVLATA